MAFEIPWAFLWRTLLVLFLAAAAGIACFTLPVQKLLKGFLAWIDEDLGPWGPLVLTVGYIPLTILAVPASVLSLGGGYLFGLLLGFISDSVGATLGAGAAFLLGRTLGRPFVMSRLKDCPNFNAITVAIERSGFKIMLLLRLAPLVPFNVLNYFLSVTPVPFADYLLASWLGMIPITVALVYVGTTLKDISDVTHEYTEFSLSRLTYFVLGILVSVVLMICVTQIAKNTLEKVLAENPQENEDPSPIEDPESHNGVDSPANLQQPLIVHVESPVG
ncbi:uncharacterized protein LOC127250061 [Andrographis paniculata]|uniref:uncharacterized protein LOC127250061 n=1 Tax=Andrographis paniculata TaxID=175694 RepID=UPI0021E8FE75|nr:uncharacterized protein LOC127250061 [Andrographis paniculata]